MLPALAAYDAALVLDGSDASLWREAGDVLGDVGEHAQAIGTYERSLALDAASVETRYQLARARYRMGQVEASVAALEQLLPEGDAIEPWLGLATVLPGAPAASSAAILDARRAFAERLRGVAPEACIHDNPRSPGRRARLRVGYVSSFFDHPNYMRPVWGLLNHHDRARFEVHLFADCDATSLPGYRPHPGDRVHAIEALETADVARCIDDAGLDVLVDLNAYSTPMRLCLYLGRRAPRVVAWFNMFATSGLPGIDVIVGDASVVQPGEEVWFSERVERLPLSYISFMPDAAAPPVVPRPYADAPFSFGSLSSQYKLNDAVVDTWSHILQRAPGARLVLANADLRSPCNREHLQARFAERGVDSGRLTWLPPGDNAAFVRHYDHIDLALDPFPYAGGTTTTEALWQGVPVLTLRGDRWAARTSASLLDSAGLARFACPDVERYVEAAVTLATDAGARAELADLRPRMRELLRASRVCDCAALARGMEAIYVG